MEIKTLHVTGQFGKSTIDSWNHVDDWMNRLNLKRFRWDLKKARFALKLREGKCKGIAASSDGHCQSYTNESVCPTMRCRWVPSPFQSVEWKVGKPKPFDKVNAARWGW